MISKKEDRKKISVFFIILIVLLGIQVVFMVYTNLFCIPETMDNDSAKLFIHAMEMWKNRAVFIPSWTNQTTLEIDCPLFLAVPIYGLCRNIYIAFGVSNIIITVFFVFITYKLLRRLDMSGEAVVLTMVLILIPYSFGQLLYYNMTFFAGGQYIIKTLVPLLFIEVLSNTKRDPLFLVLMFLSFICAVSSGEYVFLTGLFPVMACYTWLILLNKQLPRDFFSDRGFWTCGSLTVVSAVGVIISHVKDVGSSTGSTVVVTVDGMTEAFLNSFRSFFELLGAFPYNQVSIMSVSGLNNVTKAFLTVAVFIVMIFGIGKCLRSYLRADREKFILSAFMTVILFDCMILWFTGRSGEARYFTCSLVMGLILTGNAWWAVIEGKGQKPDRAHLFVIRTVSVLCVFAIAVLSDLNVIRGECYPEKKGDNAKLNTLISYIEKNSEKTVVFLNDTDSAEMLRVMDYESGRLYLAYKTEDDVFNKKGLVVNDYYLDLTDASRLENKHLLIVNTYFADIEQLPEYLKNRYTRIDEFQNFVIYRADINKMDGLSGIEYNSHSRDYCYSRDYTIYDGEISDDGSLTALGRDDHVISSYYLGYYTGNLDIVMKYSGECPDIADPDGIGALELWDTDSHEIITSADLPPVHESGEVKMEGVMLDHQNTVVKVYLKQGCSIKIDCFDYYKQENR